MEITRSALAGRLMSGQNQNKLFYSVFGYAQELSFDDYLHEYNRNGMAKRIIDASVSYTWNKFPAIVESEPPSNGASAFEEAVNRLSECHKLPQLLKQADTLACIGRYSVVVIGDNEKPDAPLRKGGNVAYINAYSEKQAQIDMWDTDTKSPRYGLPETYRISVQGEGGGSTSYRIHHSRVIHIADGTLESRVYGTPKLKPAYNFLQDLTKISGASAEMFYLGAYHGLALNVDPERTLTDEAARAMDDELQKYASKLQRHLRLTGVDVQQIASTVADPRGNFDVLIQLISAASGIPTRILLGSEQGQLASSVDEDMFLSMIAGRQSAFAENVVLRPLIDRLIEYELVPKAAGGYKIEFEPLLERRKSELIADGARMVQAARQAVGPGGEISEVLTRKELREAFGLPAEMPESDWSPSGSYDEILDELPMHEKQSKGLFARWRGEGEK